MQSLLRFPNALPAVIMGLVLLWGLLCGPVVQAQSMEEPTAPPASSTSYQQTISLEEGWNLVSLRVAPEVPTVEELLGPYVDEILMVKNLTEGTYMAREDLDQLGSWAPHEAYFVYAESAMEWTVDGAVLSPGGTPLALTTGWNLVPYLPEASLPVEEALASVLANVLIVDDGEGNVFVPEADIATLDSLHAGQGYKLYAMTTDTLRYAPDPAEPLVANTLAEALALEGLTPGHQVEVRGYSAPGDGGGGLFEVTDDACTTDGGTCFVFDEDRSAVVEATTSNNLTSPHNLVQSDLVWGSIEVQYGATTAETLGTKYLHGHSTASSQYDWIDYKAGTIGSSSIDGVQQGARFKQVREWAGTTSDPFIIRYQYATSNRRLKRIGVTDSVDIKWWGAQEADSQNPTNEWWRIAYAVNAAAKLYEQGGIDWAYVDIPGEFYYRNTIRLRNGVMLRGTSSDTFGEAANGQSTYGKLTLLPGSALYDIKSGWDDVERPLRYARLDLTHAYGIAKVGMQSLEVDGNIPGNMQVFDDQVNYDPSTAKNRLQDANSWNGFASKGVLSWQTAEGAVAQFTDVYIHDFPGNGFGMGNALDFTPSENVRVGGAQKNHQLYRTRGLHDDWAIEGAGWASILKVTDGTFTDLQVNPGPNFLANIPNWTNTWTKVFDHHGKDFGWDPDTQLQQTRELVIDVDGFEVDLSNGNDVLVTIFREMGFGGEYKNGTIYATTNQATVLFQAQEVGNGPIRDYLYENINMIHQGSEIGVSANNAPHTHNQFRNIAIDDFGSPSDIDYFGVPRGTADDFSDPYVDQGPIPSAARLDVENFTDETLRTSWIIQPQGTGDFPYDMFVSQSSIKNDDTIRARGILYGGPGSFRLYLHDVTFNVWKANQSFRAAKFHWNTIGPNARIRLRDSQDRAGRVSDSVGNTFVSDAGDEGNDYVLIPTNLMSYANEHEVTISSGPADISVSSVKVTSSDGTPRPTSPSGDMVEMRDPYLRVNINRSIAAGETLTLDWTARVTPLDAFSPTGLFVSRPVADQTISATTEIDLRGVAASMESREAIVYSASSDDETVVSASMQADDFTLELSPGASGTATVTVTGEIAGVGSVSHSFTVTAE